MAKNIAFPIIAILLLNGCAPQSVAINQGSSQSPDVHIVHDFYAFGIGQSMTVDAANICQGAENVVRIETGQSPSNTLTSFLTLGIYTPREAKVYCNGTTSSVVE